MFHRKQNQVGEYTAVPAGVGGTANYPVQAGRDVDMKSSGYGNAPGMVPQQQGYGGDNYVQHHGHHQHHQQYQQQQTPVSYDPAGQPIVYPKKKNNRAANWCAAAFVACWACTWPCHGPCCCGA